MKLMTPKVTANVMLAAAALAFAPLLPTAAHAQVPAAVRLADDTRGIAWHTEPDDIIAAMRQAIADHSPVLIELRAGWCPWCRKMDEVTFSDADVQEVMSRFVCIEVDTDTPFGQAFVAQLGTSGVPTTVLYNASGTQMPPTVGYKDPADYIAALSTALGD